MRPKKCRQIDFSHTAKIYKPAGVPVCKIESVELEMDELEAIRLVDNEQLYQEEACKKMGISRSTLGRLISSARRKIADALVNGKSIVIQDPAEHIVPLAKTEKISVKTD